MERDILTPYNPDNPGKWYLHRQMELLYSLTVAIQRDPLDASMRRALGLICFGAYNYMKDHGEQGWADRILLKAQQISHPASSQKIQGQEVVDAAH